MGSFQLSGTAPGAGAARGWQSSLSATASVLNVEGSGRAYVKIKFDLPGHDVLDVMIFCRCPVAIASRTRQDSIVSWDGRPGLQARACVTWTRIARLGLEVLGLGCARWQRSACAVRCAVAAEPLPMSPPSMLLSVQPEAGLLWLRSRLALAHGTQSPGCHKRSSYAGASVEARLQAM